MWLYNKGALANQEKNRKSLVSGGGSGSGGGRGSGDRRGGGNGSGGDDNGGGAGQSPYHLQAFCNEKKFFLKNS